MTFKNLGQRVAVAAIGGPLVVAAAWYGGWYFFVLVVGITLLALHEFLNLMEARGGEPLRSWIYLAAVVFLFTVQRGSLSAAAVVFAVFLFGLFLNELRRVPRNFILNTATAILAFCYLPVLYAFLLAVRGYPANAGLPYRAGGEWILLILLSIWVCDTAAYFVGSRFGQHKLAPAISPNKSVEGAVGGLAGGVLTAILCRQWFATSLTLMDAGIIGLLVGVFGQLSDLVESQFKRDAGVKDASSLLPGHGGILDRFDSQLLAVPVVFVYLWMRF